MTITIAKWRTALVLLKEAARTLGATDDDMAKACGVTAKTFRRWGKLCPERGIHCPSGANRRADAIRDLARLASEKAGEL